MQFINGIVMLFIRGIKKGNIVSSAKLAIDHIQKLAEKLVPTGISLAEELIRERREQAKKE